MNCPTRHVADIDFVDGVRRPAWETRNSRQFVLQDDGEPVYGV
jgi:hypothetical protein